ncbi:Na+/H+ antiporter NhaA [Aliifodinibius salipaludis]|uniref:Na(+)/H(+) antiporter NhaA n=1 Tax=Fodinibius salipaludis TaxID=2032627 RepID=A0A2A2GB92_9BACT|nr:Na+/H+ antiporter NhaA [Aliifodinibius salipaludis]PAU94123.1 Na+/H+ antiporter NhaA [Aliifodinibius salipaludis]
MKNKITFNPLTPIQEFFKTESSSGILLLITTVLALLIANSPMSESYFNFFQSTLTVGTPSLNIEKPLLLWINDGLMAVFFLLIGLEIKRELKYGELSNFKLALTPIVAALGGALVPGAIFIALNAGTEFSQGWAIAIATDIAFAIGILTLLGSKVPIWAKVFLTAVAVVDDLIAVMAIALFYTASIQMTALAVAAGCFIVLLIFNLMNVRRIGFYMIVGIIMWVAVLKSGVHATIAGVVLGLIIPATRNTSLNSLLEKAEGAVSLFKHALKNDQGEARETALNYMDDVVSESESPLHRLEHHLHPWVAYGIIPVFAFANAGVAFDSQLIVEAFSSTLTWGILLGLFVGKQIGIFSAAFLMKVVGLSTFPEQKGTWKIVYGLACLSGVGFTMSLFIGGLSFESPVFLEYAKVGIISGSLISGLLGYGLIRSAINNIDSE